MGATLLPLTGDELLTTTRAVRKRLDLDRPVSREVLSECVEVALQAPSGSNQWGMRFVIVDDPGLRRQLGHIYRACYERYRSIDGVYIGSIDKGDERRNAQQHRSAESADHLAEHMGDAPALVLACAVGRADGAHAVAQTALLGS